MNWNKRQAECKKCQGYGYVNSALRHEDGHTRSAWTSRCECKPSTVPELEEAAAQEAMTSSKS